MKTIRCAIYTRKSSEEGLEQAFNSLDAQREACGAYILSQASEGWTALPEIYDDGGISGGTLERPALKRMLAEVAAGRIDIIVVYKVDRLTRSLTDFSKLVDVFDKAGTSFVSVTQSFNTTTSMGRLTLNMLLSFAQFEREVTAERIRDKIAASKAKGMWMGGTPPLGYAPDGRSLQIVEAHAAIIRDIFARYLDLRNVTLVERALAVDGITTPARTRTDGNTFGGGRFFRGQIYHILKCPTYVGEIHHREQIYPALHEPIVDRATWDRVQAVLSSNVKGERSKIRAASPSLLTGLLVDAEGAPLIATHANKPVLRGVEGGKVRYRYYVSKALQQGDTATGLRVPAREIEVAVAQRIAALFGDALGLAQTAWLRIAPSAMLAYHDRCATIAIDLAKRDRATLRAIIASVTIHHGRIDIICDTRAIASLVQLELEPDAPAKIDIISDVRLTRSGRAMRLIQDNGAASGATQDRSLIRLLVKAREWWALLREGDIDITTLAERERVSAPWITRVLRLAFLSPTVVEAILAGNVRAGVDAAALVATGAVSGVWAQQERALLPTRIDRHGR